MRLADANPCEYDTFSVEHQAHWILWESTPWVYPNRSYWRGHVELAFVNNWFAMRKEGDRSLSNRRGQPSTLSLGFSSAPAAISLFRIWRCPAFAASCSGVRWICWQRPIYRLWPKLRITMAATSNLLSDDRWAWWRLQRCRGRWWLRSYDSTARHVWLAHAVQVFPAYGFVAY